MDAWSTVLGQRTMENINYFVNDLDKVIRNYPTLRDQFAMAFAQSGGRYGNCSFCSNKADDKLDYAEWCYKMADAMLAARGRKGE